MRRFVIVLAMAAVLAPLDRLDAQVPRPVQMLDTLANMLRESPRDPRLLRQRWLLLMAVAAADTGEARRSRLREAMAAGDFMAEVSPTEADSAFYRRQIAVAVLIDSAAIGRYALRARQAFPAQAAFWDALARAPNSGGQPDTRPPKPPS
jgi:hypothetical protein